MTHNDRPVAESNRSPRQSRRNREKHGLLSVEKAKPCPKPLPNTDGSLLPQDGNACRTIYLAKRARHGRIAGKATSNGKSRYYVLTTTVRVIDLEFLLYA